MKLPTMSTLTSLRPFAFLVACLGLVLGGCFGDDVTPQNTSIAGQWKIACQPVNEDCPNFSITFDAEGDITDYDLDGHRGPQRGIGSIVDTKLAFKVGHGNVYEFSGMLNGSGRAASGAVTNFDYDGQQKTTQATATRQ